MCRSSLRLRDDLRDTNLKGCVTPAPGRRPSIMHVWIGSGPNCSGPNCSGPETVQVPILCCTSAACRGTSSSGLKRVSATNCLIRSSRP